MSTTPTADQSTQTAADETAAADGELSKDDAFHLLQNARRRAVLRYLIEEGDERFVMRDVAEAVAAWEHDTTVRQLTSDERQRVYIGLYQSHLPKLDEHDVIDYDQDRGIVEPCERIALLAPYLEEGLDAPDELVSAGDPAPTGEESSGLRDVFSRLSS